MTCARKALAAALGILLVVSPMASAEALLPHVVDDHIGEVDRRLDRANSTYGERTEFRQAKAELGRASLSLLNNASLVALDKLQRSVGAIETGIAREKVQGSDKQIVDFAREDAQDAREKSDRVRDNLESMERTGLEPVAFSGGLTVATLLIGVQDGLAQYERGNERWHSGQRDEASEHMLMTGAASAKLMADVAAATLSELTDARANATSNMLVSYDELNEIADKRVNWTKGKPAAVAKNTRDRVLEIDEDGGRLMTLAAFTSFFEDLTFNGLNAQLQRGRAEVDPIEEPARLYNETRPAVEDWNDLLDIPGDIPLGALEGARLYIDQARRFQDPDRANTTGALALSQVHLAIEHMAIMQETYGNQDHVPGQTLKPASIGPASEDDSSLPVPGPAVLVALASLAVVAFVERRRELE